MRKRLERLAHRVRVSIHDALSAAAGYVAVWLLKLIRHLDPDRTADFAGRLAQRIGPWLPEHRVGRANLAAAYPEKSAAEIEAILRGVWDNLGRVAAEFAHLDRLWYFDPDRPEAGRVEVSRESIERFLSLRDDGKPALVFAAHLANWELPAVLAAMHGIDSAVLYRAPNVGPVARAVKKIRAGNMGALIPTGHDAALRLAYAMERGTHVGMLVDQHFGQGVEVQFFGRPCKVNPLIARLARHFDCPIHGVRVIRLPNHRFRAEITEAVAPVRDAEGRIDIRATMQVITNVVEKWVREHPEQWLWLHRRWR
jgi:KDO2-lipid IV(A) lauroyltransferase